VAMRRALPEVRKWLVAPAETSLALKASPAVTHPAPMSAD
jgi:hypothetical protein